MWVHGHPEPRVLTGVRCGVPSPVRMGPAHRSGQRGACLVSSYLEERSWAKPGTFLLPACASRPGSQLYMSV